MPIHDLRARALDIFSAALDAAHPHQLIRRALELQGTRLRVHGIFGAQLGFELEATAPLVEVDLSGLRRVVVVGAGKATAPMAQALEELLEDRLEGGIVSVKYGHGCPLERITLREAGHPIPDRAGLEATAEMMALLEGLGEDDLVFVLLSGGGSALLAAYAEGISLEDARCTFELLLASGAPIEEMNVVRKHISQVKGGQLARLARPARLIALVLSDVIGDPLSSIASGPTVPDPSTFAQAVGILTARALWEQVPVTVRSHLEQGVRGEVPETPKPGEPGWEGSHTLLIGNSRLAVEAAADRARSLGLQPRVLTTVMEGEAREVGAHLSALLRENAAGGMLAPRPFCLICGGETTVTLPTEHGRGGRNQELALAAALDLEGSEGLVVLAGGTDGTDGPTDVAGALVDGGTVARGRAAGRAASDHLLRHDAYPFLEATGDLIRTGPTLTNVMDLVLLLAGPSPRSSS
jgi:glycerate 2-kinase